MRFACGGVSTVLWGSAGTYLEYDLHYVLHRRRNLQLIQPRLQPTLQIHQHIPHRSFRGVLCWFRECRGFRGSEEPFLDLWR